MTESVSKENLIKMYETMLLIRRFEEAAGDLVKQGEIKTPCHLYIGQEAVAAGVCSALEKGDYVFGNHRSHGHYIAKGGDINKLMAELFCKKTGCSEGKGGSMHIIAPEVGFMGAAPIVAGTIPIAAGSALSARIENKDRVCASFFGDGAASEGVFYETLNFAALRKLPVIFICENNLYSTHMSITDVLADTNIAKKAQSLGMPGFQIDGNDAELVFGTAKAAIERARKGEGPTLIECLTYRLCGHVGPDDNVLGSHTDIRSKEELDIWKDKCPINRLEEKLMKQGLLSKEEKNEIAEKVEAEVEGAVNFARESPHPEESDLLKDVFKD